MAVTYQIPRKQRPKKHRKWIAFTALMLSTIVILFFAANTGEQRLCQQTYRQTLDELLRQYGANENYGLQSVSLIDFWQDGTPELVVVRTLDETDYGEAATRLMIYAYCDGEAQLRLEKAFDGGTDILWKRDENGLHFYGSTALTHPAHYPGVRQLITLTVQADGGWQSKTRKYVQIHDGRWIDHGNGYSDEGRLLTDEESAALLKGAESLMGRDWQRFLKENRGTACYQRAYLDIFAHLESIGKDPRYTSLVDFNGNGYPEMVTTANDKLYFYGYDPESGKADLVWGEDLGCPYGEADKRLFGINLTLDRPALVIYFGPNPKSEFIEIYQWDEGAPIRRMPKCTLQARGDESGHRDKMHDWHSWYDDLTQGEYEELRLQYLQDAVLFDTRYHSLSLSGSGYTDPREFHECEMPLLAHQQPQKTVEIPAAYAEILTALIADYGMFDAGDGTLPVLGLKYAGLHDLGGDETPELVTLVNTKDEDLAMHMTLRVYCSEGGTAKLTYQTELGSRYRQTDVSYSFAVSGYQLMTYHSSNEWTEEVVHVIAGLHEVNPDVQVYRALFPEDEDVLPQFWMNGQEVSAGGYSLLDRVKNDAVEYDACWDISPAGRAELMFFLEDMGITPPVSSQAAPAETIEPAFSVSYGELTYQGKTYGLPQYSPLTSNGHTVEQVGKHLLISTHVSPDHNVYAVFNTETLTFENSFWGLILGWQEDELASLIYCQWNELYNYDGFSLGLFAQTADPNVLRVEGGRYSPDGKTFTVSYSDDALLMQEETFYIPDRDVLEAANLLNGRIIWRTGLWFCPTANVLTHEEARTLATELVSLYGPCAQWPFESAQVAHTQSDNVKLTLLQPHEQSRLCLAYIFYLEPDGTIRTAEDAVIDGYSGTLVYENDSCALIASRRAEGCLLGGEPCGDCFVTDLYLWNETRTECTLLLEGEPLAINFTVLDTPDKTGILSIAYDTGPSHSEYSTKVFADIDPISKTYIETAREHMPV